MAIERRRGGQHFAHAGSALGPFIAHDDDVAFLDLAVGDGVHGVFFTIEDARRVVGEFVEHYNTVRLHSALGYVTPRDRLEGRHQGIYAARDQKLEAAREARRQRREGVPVGLPTGPT